MIKVLKDQVEVKKKSETEKREYDKLHIDNMLSSVKKFYVEKKNKFIKKVEKINTYKNDLDKQIVDKLLRKKFMNENEKEINTKLLQEVFSEFENVK